MAAHFVNHPSPETLRLFCLGKLDAAAIESVEEHLESCPECRRTVAEMPFDTFLDILHAARPKAATPAPDAPSLEGAPHSLPAGQSAAAQEGPVLPRELADHARFRILAELGRGGMGVVYEAEHRLMKRPVAIKVISKAILDHPQALERFRREVQAAAQLDHPNIVRAYDAEQAGDLHILVMEFVDGLDLAKVLERKGPLPIPHSCHYIRQAALGLQHAFEKGMVHRDLKPQNLMLVPNKGTVKILDFGLARLASEPQRSRGLTAPNAVMGTPEYVAPEQATDASTADIRADIYSLGCTLYCLISGRPPFPEVTPVKMILAHLEKEPTPLHEVRPEVSRELSGVVAKMLAKEPDQRYQTPAEVARALAPFCKLRARSPAQSRAAAQLSNCQPLTEAPAPSLTNEARPRSKAVVRANPLGWLRRGLRAVLETFWRERKPASHEPKRETTGAQSPEAHSISAVVHRSSEPPPPSADPRLLSTSTPAMVGGAGIPPDLGGSLLDADEPWHRRFGNYELLRKLGQGSTGIVYLARHIVEDWHAALKVLPGARFTRPNALQRLLREARIGAGLQHPNLCQILDAGTVEGEFYLAMEYLEGQSLRARLAQQPGGRLSLSVACSLAYQLFDALAYLARKEVVHRDIKPGNLMVGTDDRLMVMDLGLAKSPDPEGRRLTLAGVLLGTSAYMAPEQILDASQAGPSSDLYAAGVTLYEMATGITPFRAGSPMELMQKGLTEPAPDPRTHCPDLPEPLARILLRLLDKNPISRPGHEEVLEVLQGVASDQTPLSSLFPPPLRQSPPDQTASLVGRVARAVEQIDRLSGDDLLELLPTEGGKVRLGNHYLEERLGPRAVINTYRSRHYLVGCPHIVRLLPLALSQIAPERLRDLLTQRAQLMQLTMQSPHLARLIDLNRAELRAGAFTSLYYVVEDFVPGKTLAELITSSDPAEPALAERCLFQAAHGLLVLHQRGIIHGNLHPGKLFYDTEHGHLRVADWSQARAVAPAGRGATADIVDQPPHDALWLGDSSPRYRQYIAPEILCDHEPPGPLAEQYALGVLLVELLTGRFLRTHQNELKLMKCVQEDLQECLLGIGERAPRLAPLLRRMVAINSRARYPNLGAILDVLSTDMTRSPADQSGASDDNSPYDVFVSYRRNAGSETARAIVLRLAEKGFRAFLDVDSLESGRFDEKLLSTIKTTPNFLVILTEGSLYNCVDRGDWLRREITQAIKTNRNIVPVFMPRFHMPPPEDLPDDIAPLATYHGVSYRHDFFDEFIVRVIKFMSRSLQ